MTHPSQEAVGGAMREHLDAVVLDIGGTLVAEAPPGTPTAQLEVRCLPHVIDDLRVLARLVRLAAATNTAVMSEADVRLLLAPSGLDDLLKVVLTSADVGAAKPDPTVLLVALERLRGIPPERALFIGDQPTDAEAAAAAGMPFALVHPDGVLAAMQAWLDQRDGDGQRRWSRPVPLIGDRTSSAERSAQPDAWRLSDADRRGLYEAIHTRAVTCADTGQTRSAATSYAASSTPPTRRPASGTPSHGGSSSSPTQRRANGPHGSPTRNA